MMYYNILGCLTCTFEWLINKQSNNTKKNYCKELDKEFYTIAGNSDGCYEGGDWKLISILYTTLWTFHQ